jgi:hypothetical protein
MKSIGKFYSRRQGWIGDDTNNSGVKYFNSSVITNLPPIELHDKNGKFISNHLKANDMEHDYKELLHFSKIYPTWYFYYDNEEIYSSDSL